MKIFWFYIKLSLASEPINNKVFKKEKKPPDFVCLFWKHAVPVAVVNIPPLNHWR